eukprot:gene7569-8369_t
MATFNDLSDEVVIYILTYLRAHDFASIQLVNKVLFPATRWQAAIQQWMNQHQPALIVTPLRKQMMLTMTIPSPASLYVFEATSLLNALSLPTPLTGKGYWISTAWVASAKKYFESLILPDLTLSSISSSPTTSKKNTPNSKRKGTRGGGRSSRGSSTSDHLPYPALSINQDLLCAHGGLAMSSGPGPRRRAIDSRGWHCLRKYFPYGPEFKCAFSTDCVICVEGHQAARAGQERQRVTEIAQRRSTLLPAGLEALFDRKSGVPSEAMYRPWAFLEEGGEEAFVPSEEELSHQLPLASGLYNLVPRKWLKEWRRYVKDPSVTSLAVLDCSRLLCFNHGMLVVPPHLEEFLVGLRRGLLSGLGDYEGEVVELVTAEEWEELQHLHRGVGTPDLAICCAVDGHSVLWSVDVCNECDPLSKATYAGGRRDLLGRGGVLPRHRQVVAMSVM